MAVQLLMTPVADVTATLGTGQQILDMSGRWAAMQSGGRIIGAVDMVTGVQGPSFSWTADNVMSDGGVGFAGGFAYRNNIPLWLYDSARQRFCGPTGTRTAGNNPEATATTFIITDINGKIVREPGFSGNMLGTAPTEHTPLFHMTDLVCWNGQFWAVNSAGIGDDGFGNPTLCGGTSEDNTVNWLPQATVEPLPDEFSFSYSTNINGNTSNGARSQLALTYNQGVSNEQRLINVTELDSGAGDIRAAEDFPGWGSPIDSDQTCTGLVLPTLGPEFNYNFQQNFNDQLTICGWDGPSGTNIDKTTGLPNHSLSSHPAAFDIEIGNGEYYTPLFPTEFNFNGVDYSFGASDGVIRAMTILNGNVMALAEYTNGIGGSPGLLLMQGGIYSLTILKSDTLNWKMSLTYGMQGPGTQNLGSGGLYPSGGAIGLTPEAEITATPGEINEDYEP